MSKKRVMVFPCPAPRNKEEAERIKKTYSAPYEARFLGYGEDYEEFEECVGNYTCAVLMLEDGTIVTVPLNFIRFLPSDASEVVADYILAGLRYVGIGVAVFAGLHFTARLFAAFGG